MTPIEYSKWDNIDTNSEPEILVQQAPAPKSTYLGFDGNTQWFGPSIQAVIVRCQVEKHRFPLSLVCNHNPRRSSGFLSGCVPSRWSSTAWGLGLPIGQTSITTSLRTSTLMLILALRLQSGSHMSGPSWSRARIGSCYFRSILRACDRIVDLFLEGEGAPRWLYNRHAFEKWWVDHFEQQKHLRPGKGGGMKILTICAL